MSRASITGAPLQKVEYKVEQPVQKQQSQYGSVQEWLEARRQGRVPVNDLSGTAHWSTSSMMPRPPPTADNSLAAGAKLQKGYPMSMQGGVINGASGGSKYTGPSTIFTSKRTATPSFATQFAAPSSTPPVASPRIMTPSSPFTSTGPRTMPASMDSGLVKSLNTTMNSLRTDMGRLQSHAAHTAAPSFPSTAHKQVLRPGHGAAAAPGDLLEIHYVGWLSAGDPSNRFDENASFRFTLGTGDVIPGWDQSIVGMREGEVARLSIPSHLAYGAKGSPPVIPPNADLTFEVQLNGVNAGFATVSKASSPATQPPQQSQWSQLPPATAGSAPPRMFLPAPVFAGKRDGHVYRMGEHGLGYYAEGAAAQEATNSTRGTVTMSADAGLTKSVRFDPGLPPSSANPDGKAYRRKMAEQYADRMMEAEREASRPAGMSTGMAPQYARIDAKPMHGAMIAGQGDFTRRSFLRM